MLSNEIMKQFIFPVNVQFKILILRLYVALIVVPRSPIT